ncbi:MAG: putative bifunctional diguanylate cyclase/phosphodiesterase, partial [Hyphomonadaceae bacterium]
MAPAENSGQYRGDVGHLMVTMGVALACFGALLLAIIAYAGWSSNRSAVEREQQLVENALNRSLLSALNEQKSVAWWDDAVTNIREDFVDFDFVDANFGYFLTETYSHDEVFILNAAGEPIYAFLQGERQDPTTYNLRAAQLGQVVSEVRSGARSGLHQRPDIFAQGNYEFLAGGGQWARWGGHILSVDGRAAVVAAMTLVPNVDQSLNRPNPFMLVSVTYMDADFFSAIGQSLLLPDLTLAPEASRQDGVASQIFTADDGRTLGAITWKSRRPGHVLLTVILPLLSIGIAAAGVMTFNMLRRLKRASNELALREQTARHQSKHDALSGLPNRTHFVEKLEEFIARRTGGEDVRGVAAYIDVDRFKDINDTLGHHAGDQLIKAVAQRLQARLRPEDFLARFGGDEFAILCAPAGAEGGAALARRIARAFASPFAIDGQSIRVTASVGIAVAPDHGASADDLMRHADIALYEAKNQGRDRSVLFSLEMAKQVEERRAIELDLRAAIEADQLRLHYQPLIACGTNEIVGVEALLRWRHPVRGDVSPSVFIPIAEDSGLMPALGDWVLARAMADSHRWPDLEVAVNLSPVQFRHVDLEALLRRLIMEHDVDPSRFVLEITEGVLLDATDRTRHMLEAVRALGFKTSLDDFGTGYSSLAYLCNFKFDKIKIDRSFVSGVSKDDISKTIIQAVVTLGRGLGMDVVAEGVETEYDAVMMTHFG